MTATLHCASEFDPSYVRANGTPYLTLQAENAATAHLLATIDPEAMGAPGERLLLAEKLVYVTYSGTPYGANQEAATHFNKLTSSLLEYGDLRTHALLTLWLPNGQTLKFAYTPTDDHITNRNVDAEVTIDEITFAITDKFGDGAYSARAIRIIEDVARDAGLDDQDLMTLIEDGLREHLVAPGDVIDVIRKLNTQPA